jgi:hypothetical protein
MKIKIMLIKLAVLIFALILSHFLASPIGEWYAANHVVSYEFYIGPFAGYSTGFAIGYAFLSVLLFSIIFSKIKIGFYFALPVLLLALIGIMDDWARFSFIAFFAGLALSWIILKLKAHFLRSKNR